MPDMPPKDTTTTEQLVQRAVELSNAVKDFQQALGIVDVVENLEGRTDTVEKLGKKTRFWQKITVFGLCLDLCLSAFGIALFYKVDANTEKVDHVQQVVSQEVLCPLYSLALSAGFHPENHKEDVEGYTKTYQVISAGAEKLHCVDTPNPVSPTTQG